MPGFQCRCTEGQQGPAANRRRSEERSLSDEGNRRSHDDFLASYLCLCEFAALVLILKLHARVADTILQKDNLWNQFLRV
jgi:hypothetical protein